MTPYRDIVCESTESILSLRLARNPASIKDKSAKLSDKTWRATVTLLADRVRPETLLSTMIERRVAELPAEFSKSLLASETRVGTIALA
jgi:hypothetical protein